MSTRSQILVDGSSVVLYKHSDGYPDGVLPDLLPIVAKFTAVRGCWDPDYLSAQILHHLIATHHRFWANFVAERQDVGFDPNLYEEAKYLGYGVEAHTGEFHGDVEWVYFVKRDHVEVREAHFRDAARWENTKLKKRVSFDGSPYRAPRAKTTKVRKAGK